MRTKSWLLLSIAAMGWAATTPERYNLYLSSTNHDPQALFFYNSADQDVAVRARLYRLGTTTGTKTLLANPVDIQFTPKRFLVPAHAYAGIEVQYNGHPLDTSAEYALEVMPLSAKNIQPGDNTSRLTFLTTQQIYVHILPQNIHPAMEIHYDAGHALLKNTGNVSVWVQSLAACESPRVCSVIPVGSHVRLFPNTWLDLGMIKPRSGFKVEHVSGNSASQEEKKTLYLSAQT